MLSQSSTVLPLIVAAAATAAFALAREAKAGGERISGPYAHENLTIYLVHGKSADGPVPLTLDEALAKGAVKVNETGSVGELEIENAGSEEVFVHAGDIVKGGQQDRVVTSSLMLKAKSGRVPLAVFCVERGRWAARGEEDVKQFASASEMLPTREAKLAMRSPVTTAAPSSPARGAASAARPPENELEPALPANRIRTEEQRQISSEEAGPNAQSEVWRSVANIQAALAGNLGAKVASEKSETSLQLALENEKLEAARKGYVAALEPVAAKESDVIGYAFAINGRLNSADIYASNALFRKLWPRLLKASVTEAIGAEKTLPKALDPTTAKVEAFLKDAADGKASEQASLDGQKLETREADAAFDFATRTAAGVVMHRNVLARH
jgi:hypothetical protein